MKTILSKISIILCMVCCFTYTASAQFSLDNLLGGSSSSKSSDKQASSAVNDVLSKLAGNTSSNTTDKTTDALTSTLGDILNSAITYNQDLTVADLAGKWVYAEPACKFKSSDLLQSAGGSVVSSQVSKMLASFYKLLGFKSSTYSLTCQSNGDFKMKYKKISLSGDATRAAQKGYFTFEFVKLGSYSLVKVPVYVEIAGDTMLMLFEIDEFVELFRSLVGKAGISTLNKMFDYIDKYEGILIGFEMKRQ